MSLARVWTRQLYGASGAALLVPGAIVLALLALGLAGGFGALGTLSQAFAGPSLPVSVPLGGGAVSAKAAPVLPLVRAVSTAPVPAAVRGGAVRAATGGSHPRSRSTAPVLGSTGPAQGSTGPGPGSSGHTGGGQPGGGTGTGGQPSLIDSVVNLGTSVTKQVPGPVGGTATELLQSLGKTVDSVLPPGGKSVGSTVGTAVGSILAPSGKSTALTATVKSLVPQLGLP